MIDLKERLKATLPIDQTMPFSVYSAIADQRILNVPIVKPLLICVLDGQKELGGDEHDLCRSGEFVFLSNTPTINMRNIPQGTEYFALLIEFDFQDFSIFKQRSRKSNHYFKGSITPLMNSALNQFVEWVASAPSQLWSSRKQELLQLIWHMGFEEVTSIAEPPNLSHRVEQLIATNMQADLTAEQVAYTLAMSESTLRRKLTLESTHFQTIKDRVKLGHGLHLLQSSETPIGLIAQQCGYQSQSRFTDKFKSLFGLTPSELRKTRMREIGE